jgi:hypothetical protein
VRLKRRRTLLRTRVEIVPARTGTSAGKPAPGRLAEFGLLSGTCFRGGPPCGRSLAPVTTTAGSKYQEVSTSTPKSITWMTVSGGWLLGGCRGAELALAGAPDQAGVCFLGEERDERLPRGAGIRPTILRTALEGLDDLHAMSQSLPGARARTSLTIDHTRPFPPIAFRAKSSIGRRYSMPCESSLDWSFERKTVRWSI